MQMATTASHYTLGLCTTYHDPAVALLSGEGDVLFAEALERPLQYKRAINCEADNPIFLPELLRTRAPDLESLDVAMNWNLRRPLYEHLARHLGWLTPRSIRNYQGRQLTACLETWELNYMQASQHHALMRSGLNLARLLRQSFPKAKVRFHYFPHHLSHAAVAAYGSPMPRAAGAVIDSYGERGSMAFFSFENGQLKLIKEQRGPASLGFFYMKLTELCGFDWLQGEEWKVMGLAPYGRINHKLLSLFRNLFKVEGLSLSMDRNRFFEDLRRIDGYRIKPGEPPESVADLAHTGQFFFTEIVTELLSRLYERYPADNLILGGGCALNSSTNGEILNQTPFQRLHVPSAPADDGTALGAAFLAHHKRFATLPSRGEALSPYLGSSLSKTAVERFKVHSGLSCLHYSPEALTDFVADRLSEGAVVGWVQGGSEFGPRSLGHRSILADPRSQTIKDRINADIKFREAFRPYAPSILAEHGGTYFMHYQDSPYMERTLRFRPEVRDKVPGVVHIDGTGRLQSVTEKRNPEFYRLLKAFHAKTGCPILLNTSFNVMGKPIVHSMEDLFGVFMGSGLDLLVVGETLFEKSRIRS